MSQELAKKLRLSLTEPLTVINCPAKHYFADFNVEEKLPAERIILFVETLAQMQEEIQRLLATEALVMNGRLLICYPKKGNPTFKTFIHRDEIFPALKVNEDGFIGGSEYKFNQMVKLDATYTVLGLKRTTEKRPLKPSQAVSDYIQFIPQLVEQLAEEPEAAEFFQQLTPGYQRNWARYIYSAKRPATQAKRLAETITLLKKRIKSKELA